MTSWYDKSLFSQIQFQFAHWANKKPHISNFKCYVVVECMHCVPKVKSSNQSNDILISSMSQCNKLKNYYWKFDIMIKKLIATFSTILKFYHC